MSNRIDFAPVSPAARANAQGNKVATAYHLWRMNGCKPRSEAPVAVVERPRPVWAGDCTGAELMGFRVMADGHGRCRG